MSTQDNAQHSKHYPPPEALARSAHVAGRAAYDALVAEAQADYEGYWARLAREFVQWKTPFRTVLDRRGGARSIRRAEPGHLPPPTRAGASTSAMHAKWAARFFAGPCDAASTNLERIHESARSPSGVADPASNAVVARAGRSRRARTAACARRLQGHAGRALDCDILEDGRNHLSGRGAG